MDRAEVFEFFNVDVDCLSPALIWESRHEEFIRVKRSQEIYYNMDLDKREVVLNRIKRSLEVLYDHAEEWVPSGLDIDESGTLLNVQFGILFENIEEDLIDEFRANSKRRALASKELLELISNDELDD